MGYYKLCLLVLVSCGVPALARVPAEVELYSQSLDSLAAGRKRLGAQRTRLNRDIADLSGRIDKLRSGAGNNLLPLKRMKLENLLADAKDKADSLTAV